MIYYNASTGAALPLIENHTLEQWLNNHLENTSTIIFPIGFLEVF